MLNWRDPKNPSSGGAERVSLAFLRALVERGHEVFWYANEFPGSSPEETIEAARSTAMQKDLAAYGAFDKEVGRPMRDERRLDNAATRDDNRTAAAAKETARKERADDSKTTYQQGLLDNKIKQLELTGQIAEAKAMAAAAKAALADARGRSALP